MTILLMILALLPTIFLMIYIYYMDSYEKEPIGLLVSLFFLGVVSIIPAAIYEMIGEEIVISMFGEGTTLYNLVDSFLVVAVAEEGGKYFFTAIRTWNNKNFNYKFDGIVYAVLVSLGFATLENIMYVLNGGLGTAIMRALLAVPGHAIDAVYMGYHYGLAKYYKASGNDKAKTRHLVLAYVVPVLLHGFYDFCLFEGSTITVLMFFAFIIILDGVAIARVNKSSKNNNQIYITNTQANFDMNQYYANQNYMNQGYANQGYANQGYINQGYASPQPTRSAFGRTNQMFVNCRSCGALVNVCTFYCARCGAPVNK